MSQEPKVKSLYKALQILDCFTVQKPEWGITEISEQLGLYKSNVFNIVDTFVQAGYLERNPENEKYRLGYKVLELSQVLSSNISFRSTILPFMQELANTINETVYLGIPNDTEVIYLDSAGPKHQLMTRSMLGVKAPLYCTGIGKAMLAYLPEGKVDAVIAKGLTRYTEQTITDPDQLREDLSATRMRGYSIDNMEHEYGIKCIGMPLINKKKEVVAGISISGPSLRFDETAILQYSDYLTAAAQAIQEKL